MPTPDAVPKAVRFPSSFENPVHFFDYSISRIFFSPCDGRRMERTEMSCIEISGTGPITIEPHSRNFETMNTPTSDCEIHETLQEAQEHILDKAFLVSRLVIFVLATVLAALSLSTLFQAV
jgi:hypothetical protein